ncbi:MAG: hypothetical protein CML68_20280 [Rhodobacteraceae bacterium]|nr:hypothetical protein [Paracoccaceae bacterium]
MRRLSLNARQALDDPASEEIEVVLFMIEHEDLEEGPIRLSTDNTEELSEDPFVMGTRSGWRGSNPETEPFLWTVASAIVPSDLDEASSSGSLVLENLDSDMVTLIRSVRTPPTVHVAVVLASSPDDIEAEWSGFLITEASVSAGEITLSFSREDIESEAFPPGRMTRNNFPGLHL